MDRDPRISSETTAQQRTASDPTIWADYFNLGGGVESNTGNCSGTGEIGPGFKLSLQLRLPCHYNGRTNVF